jgi:alkylhydroperoxidase family enzyme
MRNRCAIHLEVTGVRDGLPEPRLMPVENPTPEIQELLAKSIVRDGNPLLIFRTLAHHKGALLNSMRFGGMLLGRGVLPAREREIVLLRTGWRAQAVYEFGQHTLVGLDCGLTRDEIERLTHHGVGGWSPEDAALVRMVDELERSAMISDATWAALRARWNDAELVELILLSGFYRMVSGFLNSTGVQRDDGVPGWPATAEEPNPGDGG